jgi:hypothetical protein
VAFQTGSPRSWNGASAGSPSCSTAANAASSTNGCTSTS